MLYPDFREFQSPEEFVVGLVLVLLIAFAYLVFVLVRYAYRSGKIDPEFFSDKKSAAKSPQDDDRADV